MADSVYRVTEVIGVSSDSWEAAARNAVETAAKTVRDLRVAEVIRQDVTVENGGAGQLSRAPGDLVQVRHRGLTQGTRPGLKPHRSRIGRDLAPACAISAGA